MIRLLDSRRLVPHREQSHPLLVSVGVRRKAVRRYADEIRVGRPGRCPDEPVLLIELFDNSGSVVGGNDPIGQRYLEAWTAISRVGARCRCGKDLVATLHFDTPTSGDLDPTPITKQHLAHVRRSLAVPPDGAGISCLGPSLTAARRIADAHPSHHVVLVALTDFLLFDDFLDQFIAFPGDVHAVVLSAQPPPRLVDAQTVTVTRVDYGSRPGAVARAVFTALTHTRPNAKPLPAA
jgi:hypothetical protein